MSADKSYQIKHALQKDGERLARKVDKIRAESREILDKLHAELDVAVSPDLAHLEQLVSKLSKLQSEVSEYKGKKIIANYALEGGE